MRKIVGTNHDDLLSAGNTDRALFISGGRGNDDIYSGHGDDILSGGRGMDTFYFSIGDGEDTITDFQVGVDRINLDDATHDLYVYSSGDGYHIDYGSGEVVLLGVQYVDSIYDIIT